MANIYSKVFEIQKLNLHIGKNAQAGAWAKWWYKYATLDKIWDEINDKMTELELVESSHLKVIDGESYIESQIIDKENWDTISSVFPVDKTLSPQDIGKAITYGRRYNLVALLNLKVVGDDDDAQGVRGKKEGAENMDEYVWKLISTNNVEKAKVLMEMTDAGDYTLSRSKYVELSKFIQSNL